MTFYFLASNGFSSTKFPECVTYESDTGYNYIYSSKGFQLIQAKSCQTLFPEITDFLAGQWFEDFNETSREFEYTTTSVPWAKKLNLIAARYLVLSYGITTLTHAIVYDTVMKRFGKLKIPHVDVFEYELLTDSVSDVPRKSIAFLQINGAITVANFSLPYPARNGVALMGKYQYVRSRNIQLQTVEIESAGAGFICEAWSSIHGKGYDIKTPGIVLYSSDELTSYGFNSPAAKNHSLLMTGPFSLDSLLLSFNVHGRM